MTFYLCSFGVYLCLPFVCDCGFSLFVFDVLGSLFASCLRFGYLLFCFGLFMNWLDLFGFECCGLLIVFVLFDCGFYIALSLVLV